VKKTLFYSVFLKEISVIIGGACIGSLIVAVFHLVTESTLQDLLTKLRWGEGHFCMCGIPLGTDSATWTGSCAWSCCIWI